MDHSDPEEWVRISIHTYGSNISHWPLIPLVMTAVAVLKNKQKTNRIIWSIAERTHGISNPDIT